MMAGQQPIIILREGTTREKGKGARSNNIIAALAISDAVKSTLGPKGMDKMLVDSMGDAVITNDGATLLKEIDVEHPAAKMIVEVAKAQDEECGDCSDTCRGIVKIFERTFGSKYSSNCYLQWIQTSGR